MSQRGRRDRRGGGRPATPRISLQIVAGTLCLPDWDGGSELCRYIGVCWFFYVKCSGGSNGVLMPSIGKSLAHHKPTSPLF